MQIETGVVTGINAVLSLFFYVIEFLKTMARQQDCVFFVLTSLSLWKRAVSAIFDLVK